MTVDLIRRPQKLPVSATKRLREGMTKTKMSIKPLVLLIGIWQGERESERERQRLHNILSLYSLYAAQVPVTINGTISSLNISDSGCARPGITTPNADLCPLDGERVNVTCASSIGYIIRGPGGRMSRNAPLIINSFILSDSGRYTCSSENDVCGTATDSILISGTG